MTEATQQGNDDLDELMEWCRRMAEEEKKTMDWLIKSTEEPNVPT